MIETLTEILTQPRSLPPGRYYFSSPEIIRGFRLDVTDKQAQWVFSRDDYAWNREAIETSNVSFRVQDRDIWSV